MRNNKLIAAILLIVFLFFSLPVKAADNPKLVEEIKDILWEHYYEPVPYDFLNQSTLEEVFKTLRDPYTKYYTDEEFREFWLSLEGKVGGIGITIDKINGEVTVTSVIPNTPAYRVNIQRGDIITHVDNILLKNLDMDEIKEIFRGEPGTYLKLRTFRKITSTYLSYWLTRENIVLHPIETSILTKNIGYIKLLDFNQEAAKEFSRQLNKFKEMGMKGLILDLRDNPGGLIGAALDISRELLPPGLLVKLYYRGKQPELITTVGTYDTLPLIVLVNGETASAAEILTGAIQDRDAGIVIGTNTYGKATVQSLVPLVNGGALKFTSGKYLTPSGRQINKIGLKPDFYIANSHDQIVEAIWMLNRRIHKSLTFQINNEIFFINGISKNSPLKPYLSNGNFMVPLRPAIESLGGKVAFSSPNDIKITLGKDVVALRLNSNYITLNGAVKYINARPILKDAHAMVPVRSIAELLGAEVEWRESTGQVIITR
ncbi:MAG: S41 family peptidase [Bacillota bacterium]